MKKLSQLTEEEADRCGMSYGYVTLIQRFLAGLIPYDEICWVVNGRSFGYPECCIKAFVDNIARDECYVDENNECYINENGYSCGYPVYAGTPTLNFHPTLGYQLCKVCLKKCGGVGAWEVWRNERNMEEGEHGND